MSRFDVTSFGEAMLRLSVPAGVRLETARQLDMVPAGAECNVLAALARLGRRCGWASSLPDNALGHIVVNALRQAGVDVTAVHWSTTGRIGTYFIEFAVPPRPTQVIYDRAHACMTQWQPQQLPWDYLLDTRILHLTGITPPLSASCQAMVAEAVRRARQQGVAVSFDVNFRHKLWTREVAAQTLLPLIQEVELLFCSLRDARALFGCAPEPETAVQQLLDISKARQVVMTLAEEGVIGWDGAAWQRQPALPVQIVDRIGAEDALAAGVLQGWLAGDFATGLRYGVALAALALSQYGDMVVTSLPEVENLAKNNNRDVMR